jgi:Glyoxalase-like domain
VSVARLEALAFTVLALVERDLEQGFPEASGTGQVISGKLDQIERHRPNQRGRGPGDRFSLPYFRVPDLAQALERLVELGGSVVHPGERWAICRDSEGSPFGLAYASQDDAAKPNEHSARRRMWDAVAD